MHDIRGDDLIDLHGGSAFGQHIRCKPTNLCKLENYRSGPLDADLMDGVRGLKRKKRAGG